MAKDKSEIIEEKTIVSALATALKEDETLSPQEKKMNALPIIGKAPSGEKEEKHLREIVEYEFYNIEEPGTPIKFPYGSTKRNMTFELVHGQKYKVPRHVARHIESCVTPIYNWKPDGSGAMLKTKTGIKSRFQMRQVF